MEIRDKIQKERIKERKKKKMQLSPSKHDELVFGKMDLRREREREKEKEREREREREKEREMALNKYATC